MLYLAFAFNVLVLAAFVVELHQARKERQTLSLLVKSRDVAEFVRADRALATPIEEPDDKPSDIVDLGDADPQAVVDSLTDQPKS